MWKKQPYTVYNNKITELRMTYSTFTTPRIYGNKLRCGENAFTMPSPRKHQRSVTVKSHPPKYDMLQSASPEFSALSLGTATIIFLKLNALEGEQGVIKSDF